MGQARSMWWADFTRACGYWLARPAGTGPDPDQARPRARHVSLHDGLAQSGC